MDFFLGFFQQAALLESTKFIRKLELCTMSSAYFLTKTHKTNCNIWNVLTK